MGVGRRKANPRWLWYAVDHATNTVLAYMFGRRKDHVFTELKARLSAFDIGRYYTDDWGAYERHLDPKQHCVGKPNTQKIERKNLNFRTWIKRLAGKTICFSKSEVMHNTVIGLLINKVEFKRDIPTKLQVSPIIIFWEWLKGVQNVGSTEPRADLNICIVPIYRVCAINVKPPNTAAQVHH